MLIRQFIAMAFIAGSCATQVAAQDAGNSSISLELNRISPSAEGGCQVVFFGKNGLGNMLDDVTWRLAVLNAEGVFDTLLALPLGSLPAGKRRIVQFNLPAACDNISEIIVNDVATCEIGGQKSDLCLTNLTVSSRADIAFGL